MKLERWIALCAMLALLICSLVLFGFLRNKKQRPKEEYWWHVSTDGMGVLDEKRFYIILFPHSNDGDDQLDIGQCGIDRGVLTSLDEQRQEELGVFVDGKEIKFKRHLFQSSPPTGAYGNYIRKLNEEIRKWGNDTDWRSVDYNVTPIDNKLFVRLVITDQRGRRDEYAYECYGRDRVEPKWIKPVPSRFW
jgi:hypothetical protein